MLATTGQFTNQRAAGRHVLAIMDTTELDFPSHEASKHGFGNCANGEHRRGCRGSASATRPA
jgi:hypothetical protein